VDGGRPPSQWRTLIDVARAFEPSAPAIPNVLLLLEMLHAAHPHTFNPADYLTPAGADLFARARKRLCFTALAELLAGRTAADVYDVDAAERERLTRLMERDADIPIVRHRRPVFIAQGTADTVVYPPASKTTADQLAAAGTDVTFRLYPGADHSGPMAAALPELLTWAAAQIGR
jgi:acetyl esterase/lipase